MKQTLKYSAVGNKTLEVTMRQTRFTGWMFETVRPYLKGRILEIGSGIGAFGPYFMEVDKNAAFSEIDPDFVKTLRKRFPKNKVYSLDITKKKDVSPIKERFDSIVFLNVLEHIEDHELALSNLRKLLKPNGRIVCLVPAHPKLYNVMDESIGHWRRYTKKALKNVVKKAGYRVDHLHYFNIFAIPGWWMNGAFKKVEVTDSSMALFNMLTPVFRFFERTFVRGKMGISLIVVATPRA